MFENTEWVKNFVSVCFNCGYHYCDEGEKYPSCHCDLPDGQAPCEIEDYDDEQ